MYAGYTGQPLKKRWNNGRGYPKNIALTDDIDFHGWDSFLKSINGEHLDEYSARNLEYYLIRRYDLTNPEKGYNQDYGGFSGERKNLPQKKEVHHAGKLPKDLSAVLKRASCIQAHMKQEHLRGFAQAASPQYALAIIRQLTDTTGNICTKKGLVINKPVLFYPH
jgi:hypothetical protein